MYNFRHFEKREKPYKFVTFSYDDGVLQDERFIEMLNKYGFLCTFNLNSGQFGNHDTLMAGDVELDHSHIPPERIRSLYDGHEVAAHSRNHPRLDLLDFDGLMDEIGGDVKCIEELSGQKVIGMAYPGGPFYNDFTIKTITENTDIIYSRNVNSTGKFDLPKPDKLMEWCPTCHLRDGNTYELAKQFAEAEPEDDMLFYLWGHTYEFDLGDVWDNIEKQLEVISKIPDITPATNGEIAVYIKKYK